LKYLIGHFWCPNYLRDIMQGFKNLIRFKIRFYRDLLGWRILEMIETTDSEEQMAIELRDG